MYLVYVPVRNDVLHDFVSVSKLFYLVFNVIFCTEPNPDGQDQENFRIFSCKELKSATNGFHASNKLGEGGFGSVFKVFSLLLQHRKPAYSEYGVNFWVKFYRVSLRMVLLWL